MKKVIAVALVATMLTGCPALSANVRPRDYVHFEGTPAGVRAWNDGQSGLITNGKASPDEDTSYYVNRRQEEFEITEREYRPSVIGEFMGFGGPPAK